MSVLHELERLPSDDALVVMPAPRIAPESFLVTGTDRVLWHGPDGSPIAALGAAVRVRASGVDRFRLVRDALRLDRIQIIATPFRLSERSESKPARPRLFGAFEFETEGRAEFILPRWLRGESWLALQLTTADDPRTRDRLFAQVPEKLEPAALRLGPSGLAQGEREIAEPGFEARVSEALRRIDHGTLQKVVLSERAHVACDADPLAIVSRLAGIPGTRFLLDLDGATLLGVSPERLVRRDGNQVSVDALAGTTQGGEHTEKDRAEQRFVTDDVVRRLAPFCSSLESSVARPRGFGPVSHLHTEVRATSNAHVLDLAAALHPTPAVGGTPRAAALAAIRELEGGPRSWWAGGAGWFDANGDGELCVAIRSMLVKDGIAHLRAGAGIVAGSDPNEERREVALKRRALLDALGVDT